jgi:hypothetical protein
LGKNPRIHRKAIRGFEKVGLLKMNGLELTILRDGIAVVRNICSQLDLGMIDNQENKAVFSKAI